MTTTSITSVAARGLWDKFAAPGSIGAIRRSYERGVPSVVEATVVPFANLMALVSDRTVNRQRQPVYVKATALPSEALLAGIASEPAVCVAVAGTSDLPWALWRWTGDNWIAAGVYVPVEVAVSGPTRGWPAIRSAAQILYESPNVVTVLAERARLGADEAEIAARLRGYAGPDAAIVRVSDFIEAEQLQAVAA